jgi:hypothetical protein
VQLEKMDGRQPRDRTGVLRLPQPLFFPLVASSCKTVCHGSYPAIR